MEIQPGWRMCFVQNSGWEDQGGDRGGKDGEEERGPRGKTWAVARRARAHVVATKPHVAGRSWRTRRGKSGSRSRRTKKEECIHGRETESTSSRWRPMTVKGDLRGNHGKVTVWKGGRGSTMFLMTMLCTACGWPAPANTDAVHDS